MAKDIDIKAPVRLNARQLRALVDAAASLRGPEGDPYFLVERNGMLDIVPPNEPLSGTLVAEIDTYDQQPGRPKVKAVSITPAQGKKVDLAQYDAVFWSEAAVEKFVLPYYASKSLWDAAYVLTRLSEIWYGFVPGPDTPHNTAQVADPEEIPFALAHLPSSEYVKIADNVKSSDDGTDVGKDLHLLFRNQDGSVRAQALADFLQARPARPAATGRGKAGRARRSRAATGAA